MYIHEDGYIDLQLYVCLLCSLAPIELVAAPPPHQQQEQPHPPQRFGMATASARRGKVLIFVVGFEKQYWDAQGLGCTPANMVDVRMWMPRDPAAITAVKTMKLVDFIVQQDGFVAATAAVVQLCKTNGISFVGACKIHTSPHHH